MKILVLPSNYPYPGNPMSGIFNERCVNALSELCEGVEVLVPRPYVPRMLAAYVPRWHAYAGAMGHEVRQGVSVYRPACLQLPRIARAFWLDRSAFLCLRRTARAMHQRMGFDAILSFDLLGAGGVAWRIGQHLGIPAAGWATGDDVRVPASSAYGRVVQRAIQRLDLIFYQSRELLDKGAALLGVALDPMPRERHRVLPRGIPTPPALHRSETRKRVRAEWGVTDDQVVVLSIGRMTREKGVFELLDAVSQVAARDGRAICLLLGSLPAFDETAAIRKKLDATPCLRERVRLLPACAPEHIWECLCGADLFAFTSYREGMPNSLLEAMAMGVPAVAFAIPSVLELDDGQGALLTVPPFDASLLAQAILRLLASPEERGQLGEQGKARILERYMVKENMAAALDGLAELQVRRRESRIENRGSKKHTELLRSSIFDPRSSVC